MKSKANQGLGQRIGRAFLVQALLISLAGAFGVFAASFTIERILIKRALEQEATHFWTNREEREDFAIPNTRNLLGYLVDGNDTAAVPASLRGLDLGFHRLPRRADYSLVYVTERSGQRLYLVFDGEQVSELALLFGLLPLALVLAGLYFAAWLAYRLSRRAVSPVERLAESIAALDPDATESLVDSLKRLNDSGDREVSALCEALTRLAQKIEDYVDRERNFTRDASHELRSPLTVIRMAADLMLRENLPSNQQISLFRIKRAARDMEDLTEAFLLLAREDSGGLTSDWVSINEVVERRLREAQRQIASGDVTVDIQTQTNLQVLGSEQVISVLIGNLVRNAFKHTPNGTITVVIGERYFSITDSGEGMAEDDVKQVFRPFFQAGGRRAGGFGVGLTIVKRLSDRFGWPVELESTLGVGTEVIVRFPEAVCSPPVAR